MGILDWLSLAGGATITVLVICALAYWIVQEARAQPARPEPPAATPPAETSGPPADSDENARPQ